MQPGYDSGGALRRRRHRRRPQRADGRRVSGPGRPIRARARAPSRARRRGGHGRGLSRIPLLRVLVRRLAAAPRDHPRAGSAAPRPRNPAARRHVHADAERRLPLARQRSREDAPRDRAALEARRRSLRRVRPRDGRDGTLRQADPEHAAAGPDIARPARAQAAAVPAPALPAPASSGSIQPGPAHDDERGGLPRSVVRDRRAQGDDVRVGHHRDVPRRALAGNGLRPAPSLHGRDRRRLPVVGLRARRHRRDLAGDRRRRASGRRRDPVRDRGREDPGARRPRRRRRAEERRRDHRRPRRVEPRSAADVPPPARTRRSCPASSSRTWIATSSAARQRR